MTSALKLSTAKRKAVDYPEPFIVPPRGGHHRQSFIILHGRGSNGEQFGSHLLMTAIPGFGNLRDAFPDGKFIFPTASKRRAAIWGRTPINQWFDNWSLQTPTEKEELQFDGLRESSEHVHQLLLHEIAAIGGENVILWGLSQGMAMSMISLLLWQGPKFAAVVGMCGWLPLRSRMESEARDHTDELEGDENPFENIEEASSEKVAGEQSRFQKAVRYLFEELQLSGGHGQSTSLEVPVFLGHGTKDEKVPTQLGGQAAEFLQLLDFDVDVRLFAGLGHWYSPDMLHDIVRFIQGKTGLQPTERSQEGVSQAVQADY